MVDHECQYKDRVAELESLLARQQQQLDVVIARQQAEIAQLKKALLGPLGF